MMKRWQLWQSNGNKRQKVGNEVNFRILSVETSQQEQHDREDGQELLLVRKLGSVVDLFEVCLSFVGAALGDNEPWAAFQDM